MSTESVALTSAQLAEEVATLEGRIPGLQEAIETAKQERAEAALGKARGDGAALGDARARWMSAVGELEETEGALELARGELQEAQRRERLEAFDTKAAAAREAHEGWKQQAGKVDKALEKLVAELEKLEDVDARFQAAFRGCGVSGTDHMTHVAGDRSFVSRHIIVALFRWLDAEIDVPILHRCRPFGAPLAEILEDRRGLVEGSLSAARERMAGGGS